MDPIRRHAAAITGGIILVLLVLEAGLLDRTTAQFVSDSLQVALASVAGLICVATALWRGPRAFWLILALGLGSWAAAQVMFTVTGAGLTNQRPVEVWEHLFLLASLIIGIAPAFRPDRRAFESSGLALDITILLGLSFYFYASNTIDLVVATNVAEYYEHTPTIVAAALPVYLWLLATCAQAAWRPVYIELLVGLVIWYAGQTISGLALAYGFYHAGLYDLPWTVSFVWIAAAAGRGALVPAEPAVEANDATKANDEWRLVRGGLIAAMPAMILMSLWNVDVRLFDMTLSGPERAKAWMAATMTTLIGLLFLVRLLSVLRRVEQTEAQRAESLRLLFTSNPHPAWLCDSEGRILEVGDRACLTYGYARSEFVRMGLTDLQRAPSPEPVLRTDALPRPADGCLWHWTREGRRLEVELDTQPIVWRGRACRLTTAIDLTDRHAAEREREHLVEQLRQSQKMEAVGRLAGGVAHDFNNILTAIIGYASLAADLARSDPLLTSSINEIQLSAERAAGLTSQLLAFSRKQVLQPRVMDLNVTVAGMEGLLHRVLGEDIVITVTPARDLWRTKADPTQIEQVVLNLAVNARDAMPRGGELRIATRNVPHDERPSELAGGSFVELSVADTGTGMTDEVRARIFEPFFTTKGSLGTGLGLATAYGIVSQSGGAISCESRVGAGTVFRVLFPRTDEVVVRATAPEGPAPAVVAAHERILLVEDDQRVRALAEQVLTREGYRVVSMTPEEAVGAIDRGEELGLLLSDVVMPVMSGPDVALRLRASRPALKVLFISGYADTLVTDVTGTAVTDPILTKPFTPDQLLRAVRAVLAR